MLLMALSVGAVAGVGAWAFRMLIGLIHNGLFLGQFVFVYDANIYTPAGPWGVGVILVPVLHPRQKDMVCRRSWMRFTIMKAEFAHG